MERYYNGVKLWVLETLTRYKATLDKRISLSCDPVDADVGAYSGFHDCAVYHKRGVLSYFLPASMASPFLQAMILILDALTMSFDSILKLGFFIINVHTSSHSR